MFFLIVLISWGFRFSIFKDRLFWEIRIKVIQTTSAGKVSNGSRDLVNVRGNSGPTGAVDGNHNDPVGIINVSTFALLSSRIDSLLTCVTKLAIIGMEYA